ncbi:SAM-dependent methyltransferase [Burkholderia ubonensis]|uniref:SAM-dependent methyltransferase n=1 Tax=Burkholderia ubonensis TaxID=101571 RepID=UPI0009B3EBB4|nr:SAM-dependent methyltransferase [Burkholderia ubonensis]
MKQAQRAQPTGSLIVVGTGIQAIGQITIEARACAEKADKLLYLASDPVTEQYLRDLNPSAESIHDSYGDNKERFESYVDMIERIMVEVRRGLNVCAAFYGHPGVFVYPSHAAIRQARNEGYRARMMPGISAEDCLFADLGIDPALAGCHSFEATDFLVFRRKFDPCSSLILWQVGVIGDLTFKANGYENKNIHVLVDYLAQFYDRNHRVVVYEASHYAIYDPRIEKTTISELSDISLTPISTLFVPPLPAKIDEEMLQRLGLKGVRLKEVKMDVIG